MVGLLKNNGMHEKYELPSGKHFAFGIRRSWVQTLVLSGRLCVLELALNMHSLSLLKGKNITKLQEVYFTRVALYMYCLHKSWESSHKLIMACQEVLRDSVLTKMKFLTCHTQSEKGHSMIEES